MFADSSTPSRAGIRASQSTSTVVARLAGAGRGSVAVIAGESRRAAGRGPTTPPAPCDDAGDGAVASSVDTRRVAYENPWITVWHDEVTRPDGSPGIYGVVHFANLAAGVVAHRRRRSGRARRPAPLHARRATRGRSPKAACRPARRALEGVRRELREETGLEADRLARAVPARPVQLGHRRARRPVRRDRADPRRRRRPNRPRRSSVRWVPFDEALAMTLDGRITDAMSVVAIQRVALDRERRSG